MSIVLGAACLNGCTNNGESFTERNYISEVNKLRKSALMFGTDKLKLCYDKEWTDYIGGKSAAGSRKIPLQVPNTLLTALKLSTTNEDITLSALAVIDDLWLSTHGGN